MTAAPVIVQPDLEAWVWANVSHIPGVTTFAYAAFMGWPPWLVAYSVQADARAKTKQAARDRAETVRQIITALGDLAWPDGVVSYVQGIEGPFWLPDPDGGPRYCARYEIRAHPAPGRSAGTMPAARATRPSRRSEHRP
jgi:hypothetical protein